MKVVESEHHRRTTRLLALCGCVGWVVTVALHFALEAVPLRPVRLGSLQGVWPHYLMWVVYSFVSVVSAMLVVLAATRAVASWSGGKESRRVESLVRHEEVLAEIGEFDQDLTDVSAPHSVAGTIHRRWFWTCVAVIAGFLVLWVILDPMVGFLVHGSWPLAGMYVVKALSSLCFLSAFEMIGVLVIMWITHRFVAPLGVTLFSRLVGVSSTGDEVSSSLTLLAW